MEINFLTNPSGYLEELLINNENIIYPWSIECGDSASFFSLERNGWRVNKKVKNLEIKKSGINSQLEVKMSEGMFLLDYSDQYVGNTVTRNATLHALKQTYLMDFVIQYRFKKQFFQKAVINNKEIIHTNSNVYNQYAVNEVKLMGETFSLSISITDTLTADKFYPVMYVRDFKNEWIIHCRLLPKKIEKEIIKLNTSWYNKAIPQWLANVFLRITPLKKFIWYRSESAPYKKWMLPFKLLRPNGYALAKLDIGEKINIKSEFRIS